MFVLDFSLILAYWQLLFYSTVVNALIIFMKISTNSNKLVTDTKYC